MRVLVIEDDEELAQAVATGLRREQMAVDVALDGRSGLERAVVNDYDVIVLDRDLPVVHGDQVCRIVVGSGPRILMLTAASDVEDRVDGLELGADDYLSKPFAFTELVARVRSLCRRAPSHPPVLLHEDLTVDRARRRASRGPRELSLTRKEFGILEMLLAAGGAVVSAEELLEHVWDANADPFSKVVAVTMTRLRSKLGDPPLIDTVVGKGYGCDPPAIDHPGTVDLALHQSLCPVRSSRRRSQLRPRGAVGRDSTKQPDDFGSQHSCQHIDAVPT